MAKHFGSIMDFTRQRNDDLMRVYHEQLALANYIVMPEIFEKVAESPASRFWVSEERAAVEVSRMLVGKPFSRMRPNKREMFQEIFRRYIALRDVYPDKSLFELVSIIVHQPAPKFYFTPRTVGEFIYRIKNGWYDKPRKPSVVASSLDNAEAQQVSYDNNKQHDRYRQDIDGERPQE